MKWPFTLKTEARDKGYEYFDANIRKLPRKSDGSFNEFDPTYLNTDVDAFRHAYVSGVFTQEYGADVADLFGRLNELSTAMSPGASTGEKNMDLWNNAVDRKYGQKFKAKSDLLKAIYDALKKGELIISPEDERVYKGALHTTIDPTKSVVALKENETGRNEFYYDLAKQKGLSREEFVALIHSGEYPGYSIRQVNGVATPVSKPDRSSTDNLG
jgi:hypothetical protein